MLERLVLFFALALLLVGAATGEGWASSIYPRQPLKRATIRLSLLASIRRTLNWRRSLRNQTAIRCARSRLWSPLVAVSAQELYP
jgi:hypothetical protein